MRGHLLFSGRISGPLRQEETVSFGAIRRRQAPDDDETHEGQVIPNADVKSNKSIHYGYSSKAHHTRP